MPHHGGFNRSTAMAVDLGFRLAAQKSCIALARRSLDVQRHKLQIHDLFMSIRFTDLYRNVVKSKNRQHDEPMIVGGWILVCKFLRE